MFGLCSGAVATPLDDCRIAFGFWGVIPKLISNSKVYRLCGNRLVAASCGRTRASGVVSRELTRQTVRMAIEHRERIRRSERPRFRAMKRSTPLLRSVVAPADRSGVISCSTDRFYNLRRQQRFGRAQDSTGHGEPQAILRPSVRLSRPTRPAASNATLGWRNGRRTHPRAN